MRAQIASLTLILWKAPVVEEPDDAARLLAPYYERDDDSAFTSSPDIAKVSNELRRRFPDAQNGPWADDLPPKEVDRVLRLAIHWSADASVVNAIVEVAREYDLIVYDPQGPSFYMPYPVSARPIGAPRPPVPLKDLGKVVAMGIPAAGVFLLGWSIDVPVLDWILMLVGGFLLSVILFLLVVLIIRPEPGRR